MHPFFLLTGLDWCMDTFANDAWGEHYDSFRLILQVSKKKSYYLSIFCKVVVCEINSEGEKKIVNIKKSQRMETKLTTWLIT